MARSIQEHLSDLPRNHHVQRPLLRIRQLTSALRADPDFVIIGAQKSGTTTLHAWLSAHPRVVPPLVKETRALDLRPTISRSAYRAYFPHRARLNEAERGITGEATPEYLIFPWVAAALRRLSPTTHLVAILRDPVERAHSHYHHSVARGYEILPFEQAVLSEDERLSKGPGRPGSLQAHQYSAWSYVRRGMYAQQLARWLDVWPRDQLTVVFYEDLARHPFETFEQVCSQLGIDAYPEAIDGRRHNSRDYEPMSDEMRAHLQQVFEVPNRALSDLIGVKPDWPKSGAAPHQSGDVR